MQIDGTKKRYVIISGRGFGKTLLQEKMAELAEANGEWVAIANSEGIHCFSCKKHIYRCGGKCR